MTTKRYKNVTNRVDCIDVVRLPGWGSQDESKREREKNKCVTVSDVLIFEIFPILHSSSTYYFVVVPSLLLAFLSPLEWIAL